MKLRLIAFTGICSLASLFLGACHHGSSHKKKDKEMKNDSVAVATRDSFAYDFEHPVKSWKLPDELKEISGVTLLANNNILAIEDLHAVLYELNLDSSDAKIINSYTFAETAKDKFDFEDVAMIKDTVYALWSHGVVFKISNWRNKMQVQEIETGLTKENNTEGMTLDPVSGNLLIACKNESGEEDEKKSTRAVYEFDTKADTLKSTPFLLIYKKDFDKLEGDKINFFPSAIAIHPVSHDVFVLSTRDNKCMAEYTHEGQLKSLQYLDKSLLLQPEGICFDAAGDLYVSTEGKHGEPAYLYEFAPAKK